MAAAGWYNDPDDPAMARWHDGARWTVHRMAKADWAGPGLPPPPSSAAPDPDRRLGRAAGQGPTKREPRRRLAFGRRGGIVVGALSVITAVAMVGLSRGGDDRSSDADDPDTKTARELALTAELGDPAEVDLPEPTGDGGRRWLRGEGRPAVALVTDTVPLFDSGFQACQQVAAALEDDGTPAEILDATIETGDDTTTELLVDLHRATLDALATCDDAEQFDERRATMAWQWVLARRRLADIGALP